MRKNSALRLLSVAVLGMGLGACGGGGDDGGDSGSTTPPAVDSQRMVEGAIQAVDANTLKVNDLTFNRAGVEAQYNGTPLLDPLQVGMEVVVTATGSNAEQIEANPLLTGMLQPASGARAASWQVNGVPVHYAGTAPASGDWVMVFGHYQTDGSALASELVALSQQPSWIEVENRVASLNEGQQSFMLGALEVDYSAARIEDGPLAEGRWVEVYGRLDGNRLSAEEVDVEDESDWPDASEVQGYVVYFDAASGLLELDRQRQLMVTSTTRFEGGSQANLQPGQLVEVEVVNGNQAKEIEFEDDGNIDEQPPVSGSGGAFQLSGTADWHNQRLTINGIEFTIDSMTRFEDGLTPDNLDGRWVELDGVTQSGLNLVREIEPDQQDGSMDLTGWVSASTLWGYRATDGSLNRWEGKWTSVECHFDGNVLSACRSDD